MTNPVIPSASYLIFLSALMWDEGIPVNTDEDGYRPCFRRPLSLSIAARDATTVHLLVCPTPTTPAAMA